MSLEGLEGRVYGPFSRRICRDGVAAFVDATGDDAGRWVEVAPPSYAAALLFAVAPAFLSDPDVTPHAGWVVHGEQRFRWHEPFVVEADHHVAGAVERLRSRGGTTFVTFGSTVHRGDRPVLESTSTFLLGAGSIEAEGEEDEPEPDARAENDVASFSGPESGEVSMRKSASRADLIRYAAASRDWNPIHWDHGAAAAAGLPGVVCHGLLMAAWLTQPATRTIAGALPLADGRFRFRRPLRPGVGVVVGGTVSSDDARSQRFELAVSSGATEHVTASLSAVPQ